LVDAKPGSSVSRDLRVQNSGSQTERLRTVVKTFTTNPNTGEVVFSEPTARDDFVKWISFDKPTFDAPPGEWQTVKMTIALPATAAFGYHFAVQFERATPVKPKPGTTGIEGAVALFVQLNAERPDASRKAEVVSFTANKKSYEFLPAEFTVKVKNTGNVHLAPFGNILIHRGKTQVASLNVNSTGGYILPGSSRLFKASWSDGFPVYVTKVDSNGKPITDKQGKPERTLKWNLGQASKLRFGHYKADLLLIYNDGQRDIPVTGSVSFWVIPWRVIFLIIAIPVIPALLVYFLMRWRFKKRIEKERSPGKRKASHA
jgi:hypothetical protein